MAIKTINDNPSITDQIIFSIETPDDNGCFTVNPYKVNNVTIYYIVRNYQTFGEWDNVVNVPNIQILSAYEQAKINLCNSDSANYQNNLETYNLLSLQLEQNRLPANLTTTYFAESKPVAVYGNDQYPAWLSTDSANAYIVPVPYDFFGNPQYGHFELDWNPVGMREGDYFISWSWSLYPASSVQTATRYFTLKGNTQVTTSIPTHQTIPGKYETLLERYRPEMYKLFLSSTDLSPYVLQGFDNSVAAGFTFLEDMANQMLDLIDSNATPESLLPVLGNNFSLKLRSNDPTLWRRQVKNAVPLFKKKGTFSGLQEALSQAGIGLKRFSNLWQISSNYTYQELFTVAAGQTTFDLSKTVILPINPINLDLYYRSNNSALWTTLSSSSTTYLSYINFLDNQTIEWLPGAPISLQEGDSIRLLYQTAPISMAQQGLENYIRTLPLNDNRDDLLQECPPKNWNIRLIAEDDPQFNNAIPDRQPYQDPLIFGWVRTEFPYSENIYNMDEYNGSTRESENPCDIDCDFYDPCKYCRSSKFDVDLMIEKVSNDRIEEAKEIITEYTPFHALLNQMSFLGEITEFVAPPTEVIEGFVLYKGEQTVLSGPQINFHRMLFEDLQLTRQDLADVDFVDSGVGTGSNSVIMLFSPNANLADFSIQDNILEVLAPNPNAGVYTLDYLIDKNYGAVNSVLEPFYSGNFTFRLSSRVYSYISASIYQDNIYIFRDPNVNFALYPIEGTHNAMPPWKINIPALGNVYDVYQILPDGGLVLVNGTPSLWNTNQTAVGYSLLDASSDIVLTSASGILSVSQRGRVDLTGSNISDIRDIVELNNNFYVYNMAAISTQYLISGFVTGSVVQFYIDNYSGGDVVGTTITILRRNIASATGSFVYQGMKLITPTNYEVALNIQNGANNLYPVGGAPTIGNLKENYLVKIGSDYYAISEINGSTITLLGPSQTWYLFGMNVLYEIYRYTLTGPFTFPSTGFPTIPGHTMDYINRSTGEIIDHYRVDTAGNYSMMSPLLALSVMNSVEKNQIDDVVNQQESITYTIEYKNKESNG